MQSYYGIILKNKKHKNSNPRKILFVTVNRSDYGIWRPILKRIIREKFIESHLVVTGSHFSKNFGESFKEIKNDSFISNIHKIKYDYHNTTVTESMALITDGIGKLLKKHSFSSVVVLGDRFEMLAASIAVIPFRVPLIHFHGGSITEGAIDDSFRHAITKLSNFHMVETSDFKKRLIQLGEEKKNIYVTGAPSLSLLKEIKLKKKKDFLNTLGFQNIEKFILVTLHSETTKNEQYNKEMAENFFNELFKLDMDMIVTAPNPDPNYKKITEVIDTCKSQYNNKLKYFPHLGHENYFNAMHHCEFLAGNSSSGIIEAASFRKIVLNVGERQKNRLCGDNVFHSSIFQTSIRKKLKEIQWNLKNDSFDFKPNLYGKGNAPETFVRFLNSSNFKYNQKKFQDSK